MNNPFSKIETDNKDRNKGMLEKRIKDSAWNITKKVATHKCSASDIDELENLYKEYFEKFPDEKSQVNSFKRISQLRQIINN